MVGQQGTNLILVCSELYTHIFVQYFMHTFEEKFWHLRKIVFTIRCNHLYSTERKSKRQKKETLIIKYFCPYLSLTKLYRPLNGLRFNPLSANPTKCSNTLKHFIVNSEYKLMRPTLSLFQWVSWTYGYGWNRKARCTLRKVMICNISCFGNTFWWKKKCFSPKQVNQLVVSQRWQLCLSWSICKHTIKYNKKIQKKANLWFFSGLTGHLIYA